MKAHGGCECKGEHILYPRQSPGTHFTRWLSGPQDQYGHEGDLTRAVQPIAKRLAA